MLYGPKSKVTVTHRETGITATVRGDRLKQIREAAILFVRSKVAYGHSAPANRVRTYELNPLLGITPYIKDHRTGQKTEGMEVIRAVLDRGELEKVRGF